MEFGIGTRKWSNTTNSVAVACIGSDACNTNGANPIFTRFRYMVPYKRQL